MAHYLVRAKPREGRLEKLRNWLDSGEIVSMRPFGQTLQRSLENARLDQDGYAVWEEEDYCLPPLAMERAAALDTYFTEKMPSRASSSSGANWVCRSLRRPSSRWRPRLNLT